MLLLERRIVGTDEGGIVVKGTCFPPAPHCPGPNPCPCNCPCPCPCPFPLPPLPPGLSQLTTSGGPRPLAKEAPAHPITPLARNPGSTHALLARQQAGCAAQQRQHDLPAKTDVIVNERCRSRTDRQYTPFTDIWHPPAVIWRPHHTGRGPMHIANLTSHPAAALHRPRPHARC